ncbi:MAG: hypothetical protein FWG35_05525 [Spirochaetaceae bacterium]|nr:hypothetical protein [Spirochaetaceae bacterium]
MRTAEKNPSPEARARLFPLWIAAACVFVFLLAQAAVFFVPSFSGFAWRGYFTVLVDGGADIKEVSAALAARGLEGFLSAATATVEFSDFDAREEVLVCDLPRRLLPEDPRADKFLTGAPALFRASGAEHILYFPARQNPFSLAWKLEDVLGGRSWTIVEWHAGVRFALFFLFCLLAGFSAYFHPGLRGAAIVLALPWLGFLVHGDPGVFAAGALVYFTLMRYAQDAAARFDQYAYAGKESPAGGSGNFRAGSMAWGVFPLCGAAALAAFSGGGLTFVPLAAGLLGSFSLGGLLLFFRWRKRRGREHRLFIPLAILPPRWMKKPRANPAWAALVCCLLAVPLALRFSGGGGQEIPRPRPVPGISSFSRESLRQLWLQGKGGLPDFSDYLCHRAYQEGFFYGYPPEFPLPEDKLTLPRYSEEGASVRRTEETLLTFDEIWYKRELEEAEKPGIGKLLLLQGVSGIFPETIRRVRVDALWMLRYLLVVAASLLPFFAAGAGRIFGSRGEIFSYGRNQQEA